MNRRLDDYWWTWMEGADWPSWYGGEKTAHQAAEVLARANPGRKISLGKLDRVKTIMLPDLLKTLTE